jgi:hypothetical protein
MARHRMPLDLDGLRGIAVEVCTRTSLRHATSNGGSSFMTTAVCEEPQDGSDDRYDRAVYRWRGDNEALLVDFPDRCMSLRIVGYSSKVAFSCSRVMPGVRITAIPEGRKLRVLDGTHEIELDLRHPCRKRRVSCIVYQ